MDRIAEILDTAAGKRPVFSFEFFPPKSEKGDATLAASLLKLREMQPDYVSVTYGAGGSTQSRTLDLAREIQGDHGLLTMAHYTSIGARPVEVDEYLGRLWDAGIRNIIALRGDRPKDQPDYQPPADGFRFGSELIAHIRKSSRDFCLCGGFYPEVHAEAESADADFMNLQKKAQAGAQFFISQLFFDNQVYFDFARRWKDSGMDAPLVPGLMPITSFTQIERFRDMAGCRIPEDFVDELRACGEDREKLLRISADYTTRQCRELLDGGAPGVHFYTLNQSDMTIQVLSALKAAI